MSFNVLFVNCVHILKMRTKKYEQSGYFSLFKLRDALWGTFRA